MYFTVVDETGSCCILIMLGDGLTCRVLGTSFFSILSDATTGNIKYFRYHFLIRIRIKRKEKPTGWWYARNTHITPNR